MRDSAALHSHRQNIDDELARACAATGGGVGVNGIGIFLGENDASTDALFRHVDHWAQLLGPRHVAIGLDAVSDRAAMAAAGYRDEKVIAILGGNWLRLAREAWKASSAKTGEH